MSRIHAITMPKWGIEMQEGAITSWHVEIGGAVTVGLAHYTTAAEVDHLLRALASLG